MSAAKRCVNDVEDGCGNSLPRSEDDSSTVIGVQQQLVDPAGRKLLGGDSVVRCLVDQNGNPLTTITDEDDPNVGCTVVEQLCPVNQVTGEKLTDDEGNLQLCVPSDTYVSPKGTEYCVDPTQGMTIACDPETGELKGPPEHHTENYVFQWDAPDLDANNENLQQPFNYLLDPALGNTVIQQVADASTCFTNNTGRQVTCHLEVGLRIDYRFHTSELSHLYTAAGVTVNGSTSANPPVAFAVQEIQDCGGENLLDIPPLGGTARRGKQLSIPSQFNSEEFDVACGEKITLDFTLAQNSLRYDGESTISRLQVIWSLICSTRNC